MYRHELSFYSGNARLIPVGGKWRHWTVHTLYIGHPRVDAKDHILIYNDIYIYFFCKYLRVCKHTGTKHYSICPSGPAFCAKLILGSMAVLHQGLQEIN